MDASGDIDHNLIPGWVGHRTCLDQCLLKRTGLARQLKGQSQSGTLGQMTFTERRSPAITGPITC